MEKSQNDPKTAMCSCGKVHETPIKELVNESGAIARLEGAPARLGFGPKVLMVADANTYEIAGATVEKLLTRSGNQVKLCLFATKNKIIPDERALVRVLSELTPDTDVMVAVGSGTINDLVRYISAKTGKPFISVPTAPSMDGYTSVVSPLIIGGFKSPHPATYPRAVYADSDILRDAPMDMIAAGFGDLIGKLPGKADWLLGKIINDEYYCEQAVDLVEQSVNLTIANASKFPSRDVVAIRALTKGLLDTGVAMLWVGNSRPASGAEHIVAHFWEMKSLLRGEFKHLHGSEVAVGTVLITKVYHKILAMDLSGLDPERLAAGMPERGKWEEDVRRVYGPLTDSVFAENRETSFNFTERVQDIKRILATADAWRAAVKPVLPPVEKLVELLRSVGTPALPEDLELNRDQVREAILHAQKSRNRYTILNVAEQLGCLEQLADELA